MLVYFCHSFPITKYHQQSSLSIIYMGEAREESMEDHSFQKLDFNLPLLSTRRLCTNTVQEHSSAAAHSHFASRDTCNRIPFCWEKAPGKPKDLERNDFPAEAGDFTPRPRLPPCRWRLQNEVDHDNKEHAVNVLHHDEGCDADVDDDEGDDDVMYSDALDVLSLTEAIDIVQRAEDHDRGLDGVNLESEELSHHGQSPNFMIERFLPDATALAASSSALYASKNLNKKLACYSCSHGNELASATRAGQPHRNAPAEQSSLIKGCGLEILLPWRIKHRLCGLKSCASHFSPNYVQPNRNPKQKKDCSTHRLRK